MTRRDATRRSFIRSAGAALSAPVAVAVASAPRVVAAARPDDAASRLARLEDLDAIRALNRAYAKHVNARETDKIAMLFADDAAVSLDASVAGVAASGFGEADAIEIAVDRQTATAWLHGAVRVEHEIGPACPVVQMAREQGGGILKRTDHGVFENEYVRHDGVWKFRRSTFRPA